jgi:hypothetical protein
MTEIRNISFNYPTFANKRLYAAPASVSFEKKDNVELSTKDKSNKDKSERSKANEIGTGIASLCITGLGQLIKGETTKAAAMFFGTIVAAGLVSLVSLPLAGFITLGMQLYSAYDAYKD